MREPTDLRPAAIDEASDVLAQALRFNGRKRSHDADEMQARITAAHLLKCLEMSGFVLMRNPPRQAHSSTAMGLRLPSPYPLKE